MNFKIDKNENGDFIYETSLKTYIAIAKKADEETMKVISKYCKEHNIIPQIIEEEKLELILRLGIEEYNKRHLGEDK